MNDSMMESGSVMAGQLDVLIPMFVAEIVVLILFYAAYFLAVHTKVLKNDEVVQRIFFAFQKVWRFIAAGLVLSFALFYVSTFLSKAAGIVMRDTSLTLFLLTGWCGVVDAVWTYFKVKIAPKKRRAKKTVARKGSASKVPQKRVRKNAQRS